MFRGRVGSFSPTCTMRALAYGARPSGVSKPTNAQTSSPSIIQPTRKQKRLVLIFLQHIPVSTFLRDTRYEAGQVRTYVTKPPPFAGSPFFSAHPAGSAITLPWQRRRSLLCPLMDSSATTFACITSSSAPVAFCFLLDCFKQSDFALLLNTLVSFFSRGAILCLFAILNYGYRVMGRTRYAYILSELNYKIIKPVLTPEKNKIMFRAMARRHWRILKSWPHD